MITPRSSRDTRQLCARTAHRGVVAALLLLAGAAFPMRAQQDVRPPVVTVSGQVVDRSSGRPLRGVLVEIPALRRDAVTDEEGRFTLKKVRPGEHTVEASQMGYADLSERVTVGTGAAPVVLRLQPDPVLLEGLTVKLNLLERRRRMVALSSRVFDRQTIATSASPNMEVFVRSYGGIFGVSRCPYTSALASDCVYSRGSLVPMRVYVDEVPLFSLDVLAGYQPSEIARVEVYQGGRQVRMYTTWFMEQLARGKRWIDPVFIGA